MLMPPIGVEARVRRSAAPVSPLSVRSDNDIGCRTPCCPRASIRGRSGSKPEPIQILAPDGSDQAFDESMRTGCYWNVLDLIDFEYPKFLRASDESETGERGARTDAWERSISRVRHFLILQNFHRVPIARLDHEIECVPIEHAHFRQWRFDQEIYVAAHLSELSETAGCRGSHQDS
jgi:hypothetical protein